MSLHILLALALASGQTSSPVLCSDATNQIEPDMRIHESDLDQAAAAAAVGKLKDMIGRGEVDGEFYFGALNQIKIIRGHVLLQQAQADRKEFGQTSVESRESTRTLCSWLGKEGFWYD
jgi:hypothetical protein